MSKKTKDAKMQMSKSMSSIPESNTTHFQLGVDTLKNAKKGEQKIHKLLQRAHKMYNAGQYKQALICCEDAYEIDAFRTDNLLLLGSIHFQLRNFSESIFYNQQCIRVDPTFAEAFSNLGNALKELGDIQAAIQFYMKVCFSHQSVPSQHCS
jgi:tetratricopeptide (TPR) repeat protein